MPINLCIQSLIVQFKHLSSIKKGFYLFSYFIFGSVMGSNTTEEPPARAFPQLRDLLAFIPQRFHPQLLCPALLTSFFSSSLLRRPAGLPNPNQVGSHHSEFIFHPGVQPHHRGCERPAIDDLWNWGCKKTHWDIKHCWETGTGKSDFLKGEGLT